MRSGFPGSTANAGTVVAFIGAVSAGGPAAGVRRPVVAGHDAGAPHLQALARRLENAGRLVPRKPEITV